MPIETNTSKSLLHLLHLIVVLALAACSPGSRLAKQHPIRPDAPVGTESFKQAVSEVVGADWISGNKVTSLVNGEAFFPAMLESIKNAKRTITFETYAYINGTAAYTFTQALCERARKGVKIHMILDSVGSIEMGQANIDQLRTAGVELHFYHPYSILRPLRYNTRDHRKIMVVDGKIGYIGGCGVADAWTGDAKTPKHWRENHYKVTGPVVAQLQHAFHDNWVRVSGQTLSGPAYFPKLRPTGPHLAQCFISAPKDNNFSVPHLYRQVIASARQHIVIENSYFIPDSSIMDEIFAARKRGVKVEVLVPGEHIDAWPVRSLARSYYERLLRHGITIHEYQPTMMHCKVLVVDSHFVSIGSANFDPRSMYINDEANLNVLDRGFARQQLKLIEKDKKACKEITNPPSRWNPLTLPRRLVAQLLAPQL
ncbi:cardiolipin synthase B [Verrucomicrobiaceae bacterium N1E253]|uniref:Cardiolipin synthase B n=1 Tax=Oceaniferula marina TaxID=2748318 RepID=A0A851GBF7_9BACT|nr:phospholipase D-like domain-containing protein [Oceaniferula marina]NWK54282.1 cardiolipin synthase B [Oceaniferula marina]